MIYQADEWLAMGSVEADVMRKGEELCTQKGELLNRQEGDWLDEQDEWLDKLEGEAVDRQEEVETNRQETDEEGQRQEVEVMDQEDKLDKQLVIDTVNHSCILAATHCL